AGRLRHHRTGGPAADAGATARPLQPHGTAGARGGERGRGHLFGRGRGRGPGEGGGPGGGVVHRPGPAAAVAAGGRRAELAGRDRGGGGPGYAWALTGGRL